MSTQPLTIGEVARLLGVSVSTVRRYEAAGLIAARRTPGGQRRFDAADVEMLARQPEAVTT